MQFSLSQPYPHRHQNAKHWFVTALSVGLFIALFLVIFQPFGAANWNDPRKIYVLSGYGVVTFVCVLAVGLAVPRVFPRWYNENRWTVGKEIGWNVLMLLVISLANLFYTQALLGGEMSLATALNWFLSTATIGVIPCVVVTLYNYNALLRKYSTAHLHVAKRTKTHSNQTLHLLADNEKDALTFLAADLLYVESADNYSEVVFVPANQPQKSLIRSSLSRLETQIKQPDIVRCHRSYIVNLAQVEGVSGNAQGYKLKLKNSDFLVPVARRSSGLVTAYFQK